METTLPAVAVTQSSRRGGCWKQRNASLLVHKVTRSRRCLRSRAWALDCLVLIWQQQMMTTRMKVPAPMLLMVALAVVVVAAAPSAPLPLLASSLLLLWAISSAS